MNYFTFARQPSLDTLVFDVIGTRTLGLKRKCCFILLINRTLRFQLNLRVEEFNVPLTQIETNTFRYVYVINVF